MLFRPKPLYADYLRTFCLNISYSRSYSRRVISISSL